MLEKMKDRNGFTLPETLAVITVLAIILVLASSTAVRLLDQTKKRISYYYRNIYGAGSDVMTKLYFFLRKVQQFHPCSKICLRTKPKNGFPATQKPA